MEAAHYKRVFVGLWVIIVAGLFVWGAPYSMALGTNCRLDNERVDRVLFRLGTIQASLFGSLQRQESFTELRLDGEGYLSLQNVRPGLGLAYSFSRVEARLFNSDGLLKDVFQWPNEGECTTRSLFPGNRAQLFQIPADVLQEEEGQRLEVFVYSVGP